MFEDRQQGEGGRRGVMVGDLQKGEREGKLLQ